MPLISNQVINVQMPQKAGMRPYQISQNVVNVAGGFDDYNDADDLEIERLKK